MAYFPWNSWILHHLRRFRGVQQCFSRHSRVSRITFFKVCLFKIKTFKRTLRNTCRVVWKTYLFNSLTCPARLTGRTLSFLVLPTQRKKNLKRPSHLPGSPVEVLTVVKCFSFAGRWYGTADKFVTGRWASGERLSAHCVPLPVCWPLLCLCPSSYPTSTTSTTGRRTRKRCSHRISITWPVALTCPVH